MRHRTITRAERGNALIEFAVSLALLAVMFAGIFEIGYSFYTYAALQNAVRAGARYAALQSGAAPAEVAKAVRNMVVYGDPAPVERAKPLVSGLTTDHVELIDAPSSRTVALRDFEFDALFMKFKLNGRPTVTFPIANGSAK
jgi:hypothetical protein